MRAALVLAAIVAAAGCRKTTEVIDADADGFASTIDCDDLDATVFPGNAERCDGVDNDCDGVIDGPDSVDALILYRDADGDGWGDTPTQACAVGAGFVQEGGDCDDGAADVHPGAEEACDDIDHDCDGDAHLGAVDATTFFADLDGDGHAGDLFTLQACSLPDGYAEVADDCDDLDDQSFPGGVEVCDGKDNDCANGPDDGVDGGRTWYADDDDDGFGDPAAPLTSCIQPQGYVANGDDCDDTPGAGAGINPTAAERCDDTDHDCDGSPHAGALDADTWYLDFDRDGQGAADRTTVACETPPGHVGSDTDCDDFDPSSYAGAPERCDGRDNDCNGVVDDGATDARTWYADGDGDGFGVASPTRTACDPAEGWALAQGDCADNDDTVFPGAPERCDATDRNCDGSPDAGATDAADWYLDYDRDGFGDARVHRAACTQPTGYVAADTDCDDVDPTTHDGADELCDGRDNDCDGLEDEDPVDERAWYSDTEDGDGYGDPAVAQTACDAPEGFVANADDCGPSDAEVHPGAEERCDALDRDCDGHPTRGASDPETFYLDLDRDGQGTPLSFTEACEAPPRHVADDRDCDDFDPDVFDGAPERCNDRDDDCDGVPDNDPVDPPLWYDDTDDGDGFGNPDASQAACGAPEGYVANADDCGPGDDTTHPGADESCDATDHDCDGHPTRGAVDGTPFFLDLDRDGQGNSASSEVACEAPARHVANADDCDDYDANVYAGAPERCNDRDDDCDGVSDNDPVDPATWYDDRGDGDGYGDPASTAEACDAPDGFVANADDCGPSDPATHPGAAEDCGRVDRDCDGDPILGAVDTTTYHRDADADDFGNPLDARELCAATVGWVLDDRDCNDADPATHPGAAEDCGAADRNCDGDAFAGATDAASWYTDDDGDGFPGGEAIVACVQPAHTWRDATDCHDDDPTAFPGSHVPETPLDGVDQDCDGFDVCHDLDCDGLADVALAHHYDGNYDVTGGNLYTDIGIGLLRGPTFNQYGPLDIEAADLDHDGYLDLVYGNYQTGGNRNPNSWILWGRGGYHTPADRTDLPGHGVHDVLIADFNKDGWEDVVLGGHHNGSTYNVNSYVYWNDEGTFTSNNRTALTTHGVTRGLHAADFDEDGYLDLVACNNYDGDNSVPQYIYYGSAQGLLAADRQDLGNTHRCFDAESADLNGDGWLDLVLAMYYDGDYSAASKILWGTPSGITRTGEISLTTYGAQDVEVADLDGDGYLDLAFAEHYDGRNYSRTSRIFWGGPSGYSANNATALATLGAVRVMAADLDLDGDLDLTYAQYRQGSSSSSNNDTNSYVYWNDGTRTFPSRAELPTTGPHNVGTGDVNGDGWPDLFFGGYHNDGWGNQTYSDLYLGGRDGFGPARRTRYAAWGVYAIDVVGRGAYMPR